MRIEEVRHHQPNFAEGYTVMITNELSYTKKPVKQNCVYAAFSLEEGTVKSGEMIWGANASPGTMKGCEEKIILMDNYPIAWHSFSHIDDSTTGQFVYLINEVRKVP